MIPPGIFAGPIVATPPGSLDPYWDNVVSLLLFNEPAGAEAVTDAKGVAWVKEGGAAMSAAQSRFGSTSMLVPNSTGYDGLRTTAGIVPQSHLLTMEGWIFIADINGFWGGWSPLFGQGGGVGGGDQMFGLYEGRVVWLRGAGLLGGQAVLLGTTTVTPNQWHHIEFGFDGRNGYIFLDGILEGTLADLVGWVNTGPHFTIGREIVLGFENFRLGMRGHIGGTRVTVGVCRHTASFTPPTTQFPVG